MYTYNNSNEHTNTIGALLGGRAGPPAADSAPLGGRRRRRARHLYMYMCVYIYIYVFIDVYIISLSLSLYTLSLARY